MMVGDVIDIAAIASGAALACVFLTCICFSIWICFRMKREEGGYWGNMRDSWRKKILRKKLLSDFKNDSKRFKNDERLLRRPDSRLSSISTLENDCSVCLDKYPGDPSDIVVALLSPCQHYFHFDCLWEWLETQPTCPNCRKHIEFSDKDIQAVSYSHILCYNLTSNYRASVLKLEEYDGNENVIDIRSNTVHRQTTNDISAREDSAIKQEVESLSLRNERSRIFHTNTTFMVPPVHVMGGPNNTLPTVDF